MKMRYIAAIIMLMACMNVSAQSTSFSRYDVNKDTKVSVADVSMLVDVLLGKIKNPVTTIILSSKAIELHAGDTQTIKPTVNSSETDYSVFWNSSDNSVATVTSEGLVTAKKKGSATISVLVNDGSVVVATCVVNVLGGPGTETSTGSGAAKQSNIQ